MVNALITTCTASVSDFSTDWEDFKQYLIVGRYLGGFSTGLSLLSRHQNIVNEVKIYCDLLSSVQRAVSKRTFYVSKRTFAVSKRTFAVSKQTVLTGLVLSLNNEIDTLSRFERNVWLLYSKYSI